MRNEHNLTVSIIMPIYNQELYLDRSLQAALNQKYTNIEIVAVNDGSTDKSLDIIKKYKATDSRITLINKENGGLIDAVATGIKKSHGDVICFLDPDDYIGNDFVSNFIDEFDPGIDVVCFGIYKVFSNQNIKEINLEENRIYTYDDIENLENNFLWNMRTSTMGKQIFNSRWNKAYKRSLLIKIVDDYELNKKASIGEDSIFTFLILQYAKKIKAIINANEYYYCINSNTSMMKNTNSNILLLKNKYTLGAFKKVLHKYEKNDNLAYYLYYLETKAAVNNSINSIKDFKEVRKCLKNDKEYKIACYKICKNSNKQMKMKIKVQMELSYVYFFYKRLRL